MPRKIIISTAIFFGVVSLLFFLKPFKDKGGETSEIKKTALFKVKVMSVKKQKSRPYYTFNGVTHPSSSASLYPEGEGRIEKILIPEGESVQKGTPLIEISKGSTKEHIADKKAALAKAELAHEGNKVLLKKNFVSKVSLRESYALLQKAQYELHQAQKNYNDRQVRAPFKGMVSKYDISIGDLVGGASSKGAISTFIQLDPIEVMVQANQSQIYQLEVGQDVEIFLPDQSIVNSKVSYIKPEPNQGLQTFSVYVYFPNKSEKIKAGLSVQVRIYTHEKESFAIPKSALVYDGSGKIGVKRVTQSQNVEFVPIELIREEGDSLLVSGLHEQNNIIIQGQDFVEQGESVESVYV